MMNKLPIQKVLLVVFVSFLISLCIIQRYQIIQLEKSEAKWVELQKLWREKLDTCMNRNERIYEQLNEFKDIRIKQLKGELPK